MSACILIPCFNHAATVAAVARSALAHGPVLVVDDGSTVPLPELPGCLLLRLERNQGKGAALRAGFEKARELGFTHAITMDSDGQHFAEDLPAFLALAAAHPEALVVGVRDFRAAGCPTHRRRSNAVSSFWFRVETGVRLRDTQCGFRGYPLALTEQLKAKSGRYAFELEFMVRASWIGTALIAVPVKCTYAVGQTGRSHFRPVWDLAHITLMNLGLVLQAWVVPLPLRIAWSSGQRKSLLATIKAFFVEHAHAPGRLAGAVGLGLFFGVVPIWGFQMMVAAAVAHWWRLNKAITLLASNISFPPMVPLILYGGLSLGHWLFTGQALNLSPDEMTRAHAVEHFWQWIVGSVVLAVVLGVLGAAVTYGIAWVARKWSGIPLPTGDVKP